MSKEVSDKIVNILMWVNMIVIVFIFIFTQLREDIIKTHVSQGQSTLMTSDAINVTIPWEVSYDYYVIVPTDYKQNHLDKVTIMVNEMIRLNFHGQLSIYDILNSRESDITLITKEQREFLNTVGVENVYITDTITINESSEQLVERVYKTYDSMMEKKTQAEQVVIDSKQNIIITEEKLLKLEKERETLNQK